MPTLPIDQAKADNAVEIFNKLRLPDVPGTPTFREAGGEWLRDIVRAACGSIFDGKRMVGEIMALVPKKNCKTTGGAGIALTLLLENRRPRAEAIYTAPTQEIAEIAYNQTEGMIENDPEGYLQTRFHVQRHIKQITDRRTKATLKIKTFDPSVMTGAKPTIALIDEMHLMSKMPYASRVIGQIRGGLIANPDGIMIIITTQSDEPPAGVFRSELKYARGVRDGRIKEGVRLLPMLYEFPEEIQTDKGQAWLDPKLWPMVLPNLGKSIHLDRLITEMTQAKDKGKEELARWASQHLNIEIGIALHTDRWRGVDFWEASAQEITFEYLLANCEVIVCGVDGGGLDDLAALAVAGREKKTGNWILWAKAWCQPEVLADRKDIAANLMDYAADGDLVICERTTQDIEEITDYIVRCKASGLMPEKAGIGLDRYGIAALVNNLTAKQITLDEMVAIQQGAALAPASWGLERMLKDGTARHAGSRFLKWVVGNARSEQRGNAVLITKQVSGKAKIDPLVAIFNAYMLMSRNPVAAGRSFWEKAA